MDSYVRVKDDVSFFWWWSFWWVDCYCLLCWCLAISWRVRAWEHPPVRCGCCDTAPGCRRWPLSPFWADSWGTSGSDTWFRSCGLSRAAACWSAPWPDWGIPIVSAMPFWVKPYVFFIGSVEDWWKGGLAWAWWAGVLCGGRSVWWIGTRWWCCVGVISRGSRGPAPSHFIINSPLNNILAWAIHRGRPIPALRMRSYMDGDIGVLLPYGYILGQYSKWCS